MLIASWSQILKKRLYFISFYIHFLPDVSLVSVVVPFPFCWKCTRFLRNINILLRYFLFEVVYYMLKMQILFTIFTFLVACFPPAPARNYFLLFGLHFVSIYVNSVVPQIETRNYRIKDEE